MAVRRPAGSGAPALDADTLFRVASITKTFTATAIVQLRDQGKLRLDDPLVKHIPEFGAVDNPFGPIEDVTLRRVASHSSGLMGEPPLDHWSTLRFPTREEWLAVLPQVRIAIPPGSAFKYSNLGYTLLGEVIERLAGQPYVEYMREAIFEPLGMASSAYELTDELRPRAAPGHMPHPFEDGAEPAPPSPLERHGGGRPALDDGPRPEPLDLGPLPHGRRRARRAPDPGRPLDDGDAAGLVTSSRAGPAGTASAGGSCGAASGSTTATAGASRATARRSSSRHR